MVSRGHSASTGAVLFVALCFGGTSLAQRPPVTGKAVKGFERVEEAVVEFMNTIGCQAATVAVSREGELLYSRGFGWRDAEKRRPTEPDALMRIASVSKPITAAATKMLIREGKLTADTKVFDYLNIPPPPGSKQDPRLREITVAHLLEHKGGWDRDQAFDPMFRTREAEKLLGLSRPAQPVDMIRYMLAQPLQFDPGERSAYSNFGYCVLGRVIEKASGKPYLTYIQEDVCKPLGIVDIKLSRNSARDRDRREVWYPAEVIVEVMDAHGGLIASAPSLCKFLDHYWMNGEPRRNGQRANWTFFGSLPGTTSMVRQRPDGYNVAVLLNGRRNRSFGDDNSQLRKMIDEALNEVGKTGSR